MKAKKLMVGSTAVLASLLLAACSADKPKTEESSSAAKTEETTKASSEAEAPADVKIADGKTTDAKVPAEGTIYMRQIYAAPHGDKAFAVANVTMNGDKIISARMDEFQYVEKSDDWTGVPNADAGFGENFPSGNILVGKEENNDAYSKLMKENGKATQTWKQNMEAITEFVKGKTISEVEAEVGKIDADGKNIADVVSGATFSDTKGYLQAIVDAAKSGMLSTGVETSNTDLKEAMTLAKPHGDKSFAVVTVAMDGDKVAATFADEFQYTDPKDFGGVPNSDGAFGQGIKDNQVLASKFANNEAYSALMKDHAKATQTWQQNIEAIDTFVKGKTIAEIEEAAGKIDAEGKNVADVVSGATFTDSKGYLMAIVDAAKKAAE